MSGEVASWNQGHVSEKTADPLEDAATTWRAAKLAFRVAREKADSLRHELAAAEKEVTATMDAEEVAWKALFAERDRS